MTFLHIEDIQYRYIWKCNFCMRSLQLQFSTPLCTINIKRFDIALECWIINARSLSTAKLLTSSHSVVGHQSPEYFGIFRRAASHYVENKILPYLVLPGPVEIDESKTSNKKFKYTGAPTIHVRWIFGMYC